LGADETGASLAFHGGDADFDRAGSFVPLHAPDRGAAIGPGGDDFSAQAGAESTAGAFVGKAEADGRHVDGLAGFIRHQNGKAAGGAGACSINDTLAFQNLDLYDHGGVGGEGQCQNAA
jgi:hypothetical protein